MDYSPLSAYLLALLTAAAFAFIGFRLKKGIVLWCIGGAILGLCIATICVGLMHAATLPYTPSQFRTREMSGIIISVVLMGITGVLIVIANRSSIGSGRPSGTGNPGSQI